MNGIAATLQWFATSDVLNSSKESTSVSLCCFEYTPFCQSKMLKAALSFLFQAKMKHSGFYTLFLQKTQPRGIIITHCQEREASFHCTEAHVSSHRWYSNISKWSAFNTQEYTWTTHVLAVPDLQIENWS